MMDESLIVYRLEMAVWQKAAIKRWRNASLRQEHKGEAADSDGFNYFPEI